MASYVVRYGSMRNLGVFHSRANSDSFQRGSSVIVRSNRGLETASVLCEATEDALSHLDDTSSGQILRGMTEQDLNEFAHLQETRDEKLKTCQRHIEKFQLEMELVEIEHLFGGERVIVYYLAEQRIDFRELVKSLASEFQTRIEMRQIGVRDEAKLLADYGDCGKPVCCNTHLSSMPPVSMKMAKIQKATLDPTKISGRCGRLKCCLRYEYDTYVEMQKELPPVGSEIVTGNGKATVLGQEILAQQLLVQMEDNRRTLIELSEVLSITRVGRAKKQAAKGGDKKSDKAANRSQTPRKTNPPKNDAETLNPDD